MSRLFESFPSLKSEMLIIRKMTEDDIDALNQITSNDTVYKYIPPFLYRKSRSSLLCNGNYYSGYDCIEWYVGLKTPVL